MTINDFIEKYFVGKTLASSDFRGQTDDFYDCFGNLVLAKDFTPFGKVITKAEIGMNDGREDSGVLLTFEGYSEPFFFYNNELLVLD